MLLFLTCIQLIFQYSRLVQLGAFEFFVWCVCFSIHYSNYILIFDFTSLLIAKLSIVKKMIPTGISFVVSLKNPYITNDIIQLQKMDFYGNNI